MGVFMPRFSIHSWNEDGSVNEPWMHPEVLDDVRRLMHLRTRLIPYLSTLLARYRADYEPVLRPLFYDFPDDAETWGENELFMLGPDILVAPVVTPGATSRTVRLPRGAAWRDGWSDQTFVGGAEATLSAPYDKPPFLIRLGRTTPIVVHP
jgi:alpha-glucosidase